MPSNKRAIASFGAILMITALGGVIVQGAIPINPIVTTSMSGATVYGATGYVCCDNGAPTYIFNNITGNQDILSSPGNGYQTANPVVGNNVAESAANIPGAYDFAWTGGVAGLSGDTFGIGNTLVTSAGIGWNLSDTTVGCCSASYMITSIDDTYTVGAAGYNGTFGAYLSIAGGNVTANDSGVASAIVEYSINGAAFVPMAQMVLAAGGNCNNVAIGGSGAGIIESGCAGNAYEGLAVDNLGNFVWAPGTTITIVATVTSYADPFSGDSLNSYDPLNDSALIAAALGSSCPADNSTCLPGFTGAANTAVATPEPATFALSGLALAAIGLLRRRRK